MAQVTGDADGLRREARSWGRKAQVADSQVRQLRHTANAVGVSKFTGPAGDRVRAYLSQLEGAASSMASAYELIATMAPRVADAIDDAKHAEAKRDKTKDELAKAKSEQSDAADAYLAAEAALKATKAHPLPSAFGLEAARQQEFNDARRRLERALEEVDRAERAAKSAEQEFERADHARDRLSAKFADLCRTQSAAIKHSAAAAPAPPPIGGQLARQLGVLNMGKGGLKTLVDIQRELIKNHYNPLDGHGMPLRDARSFGTNETKLLGLIDKWGQRLDHANTVVGVAIPGAVSTIEALRHKNWTAQQRQDYIFNHTLLEAGGGILGGTLCAPAGPVAAAACGYAGGTAGKALEKSHSIRRFTNGSSHIVLTPEIAPITDLVHGHPLKAGEDALLAPGKIAHNASSTLLDTYRHPGKILDAGGDVVSDAKGLGNFLNDNVPISPKNMTKAFGGLAHLHL